MIIFVLFYRFFLKGIIISFGLISNMDICINTNSLIINFANYLEDLFHAATTTDQVDCEPKVRNILVQKLQK